MLGRPIGCLDFSMLREVRLTWAERLNPRWGQLRLLGMQSIRIVIGVVEWCAKVGCRTLAIPRESDETGE